MATLKQVFLSLIADGKVDGTILVPDNSGFATGANVYIGSDTNQGRAAKVAGKTHTGFVQLVTPAGGGFDASMFKLADHPFIIQPAQTVAGASVGAGLAGATTYDAALPTTGQANRADQHLNTAPISGGYVGWVCVTAGYNVASAWAISTSYSTLGVVVSNGGNAYSLAQAGTSAGSGGPTGTSQGIVDGGAKWNYLGPAAVWKTFGLIS